jgi:hypothetical protein
LSGTYAEENIFGLNAIDIMSKSSGERWWCDRCRMFVTPVETPGRELDKAVAPDEFSVGRYIVAGSDYTALHLWRKDHPRELDPTGLRCPKCGGGLRLRDEEREKAEAERIKTLADTDRTRQEKMKQYMEKLKRERENENSK